MSRSVGDLEVVAVLDASGAFPASRLEAFPGATSADWAKARTVDPDAFGPDGTWNLDFHCFAIRRPGGGITLVDTGVGPEGSPASSWAPVPGRLPEQLPAAGIDPADVERVVLTHLHEDHFGWSVGRDGLPMFPNARYVLQRDEIGALGPEHVAWQYVVQPLRDAGQLHQIDGRTRLGGTRRPGASITAVPTPGHTLGHQSVLVESGRDQIVITGDVLVHAVQLAAPAVGYFLEQDQRLAHITRRRLLARARGRRTVLATAHLTQPFIPLQR